MDYFELAVDATITGMEQKLGGPFGATVTRGDEIIAVVGNRQMGDIDPSAHAEMVAVREACKKLGTRDLSDCTIYATCEPCPMCVGVILWAGIKNVYFASSREDADQFGFTDLPLRRYFSGEDTSILNLEQVERRDDCDKLFPLFWELNPDLVAEQD